MWAPFIISLSNMTEEEKRNQSKDVALNNEILDISVLSVGYMKWRHYFYGKMRTDNTNL